MKARWLFLEGVMLKLNPFFSTKHINYFPEGIQDLFELFKDFKIISSFNKNINEMLDLKDSALYLYHLYTDLRLILKLSGYP